MPFLGKWFEPRGISYLFGQTNKQMPFHVMHGIRLWIYANFVCIFFMDPHMKHNVTEQCLQTGT